MANLGRYIDRHPCLPAAGMPNKLSEDVSANFKMFNPTEYAQFTVNAVCKEKSTPSQRNLHVPNESELSEIMYADLSKSRFKVFREKFYEDMYFKTPQLGEVSPTGSKPDNITNTNTTFGEKRKFDGNLYDVVLPPKSVEQVNREYFNGHRLYRYSHNHYYPSEQIQRGYNDKFSSNNCFGLETNVDNSGVLMRRCFEHCEHTGAMRKVQKQFRDRAVSRLGKSKIRHYTLEPDKTYGTITQSNDCDVKMLLQNIRPCEHQTESIETIAYLNKLRRYLATRDDVNMYHLKVAFERYDKAHTGYIPLERILEVTHLARIQLNLKKIISALKMYKLFKKDALNLKNKTTNNTNKPATIITDDWLKEEVKYFELWQLMLNTCPLPTVGNSSITSKSVYTQDTLYREMCNDLKVPPSPQAADNQAPIFSKSQGPYGVKDILTPSVSTNCRAEVEDYDKPLNKETLRLLFSNITMKDDFDAIWNRTQNASQSASDMFSVNDLRRQIYAVIYE